MNIFKCSLVILEQRGQFLEAFLVMGINVIDQVFLKDRGVDELPAVWSHGQVLEAESVLVLLVLLNHHHVFNSDSEFAVLVVAWLIRDAHAFLELHVGPSGDADRTLMDAEKTSDTVTGSVLVIQASLEESLSCKDVKIFSSEIHIIWPDDSLEVKGAHQDSGVGFLLKWSWGLSTEVATSSDIGGTIKVLASGVQKVDLIWIQFKSSFFGWLVMDDSSV